MTSDGPQDDAPSGVTLERHAVISAELAEGDRPLKVVLATHDVTEAAWNSVTVYWMKRLGEDVREHRENATLPLRYSDAFAATQDALKPVPPMDAPGFAALTAEVQSSGGPAKPLAARGLSLSDYIRLSRHFARLLSTNPVEAARYFETLEALMPKPAPEDAG